MPLLMFIDSSKRRGNTKLDMQKYLVEKEKTGIVQLGYINDIHVIDVFLCLLTM
jgi:hypothetical protein